MYIYNICIDYIYKENSGHAIFKLRIEILDKKEIQKKIAESQWECLNIWMWECLNIWMFEGLNVCMKGAINFSGMPHDVMKKISHNLYLEILYSQMSADFVGVIFGAFCTLFPIRLIQFPVDVTLAPLLCLSSQIIDQIWLTIIFNSSLRLYFLLVEGKYCHFSAHSNLHQSASLHVSLWQPLFLEWSFLLYYTEKQQDWDGVARNLSYYLVVNANNQDINRSTGEKCSKLSTFWLIFQGQKNQ